MTDLKSLNRVELEQFFQSLGEPKFRAKQVFQWLWRGVESFDEMTNLSKALREKLRQSCILTVPKVERKQVSKLDGTIKYLWRLADGNCVESVVMRYKHGNTICVSSEVGAGWAVLLRVHVGRPGAAIGAVGDLRSGDVCPEGFRADHLQHRPHGHRRAPGQLRQRDALFGAGERPGGAEHRHAPHLIVHLRFGGWG